MILHILLVIVIQLLINLGFAYILNERYMESYKIITYILSPLFGLLLPILYAASIFGMTVGSDYPDAIALSDSIYLYSIVNFILIIGIQVIFNIIVLKRILINRKIKKNYSQGG